MANIVKLNYTADEINEKLGKIDETVLYTEQVLTNEQQAQAKANIGAVSSNVEQLTFEVGKYVSTPNKSIMNHDYFALSSPVYVLAKSVVKVTSYCVSTLGVGFFLGETIVGAAKITDETDFGTYTKEIEIPENCDNIRISVRKTHTSEVRCEFINTVQTLVGGIQGKVSYAEAEKLVERIAVQTKEGLNSPSCWTNLSTLNSGELIVSNANICTIGLHRDIASVSCSDGYSFRVMCYDDANTYLGQWTGSSLQKYDTRYSQLDLSVIYANTEAKYFKIILGKTDGSNIAPQECTAVTVLFRTSEIEESVLKEIENAPLVFSERVSDDVTFTKDVPFKAYFRASYKFPKDIHSTDGEYELFRIQNGQKSIAVKFAKAVTTPPTSIPLCQVPVYNAGFKVYVCDEIAGTLIPDGWRKELLLGEDAMSIRFIGDCSIAANQDIRLKVDAENIIIYHRIDNSTIATFTKSNYATMRSLYESLKVATVSTLSSFEIYPMNLENLTPDDLIECDIPLVGQYYDDTSETGTHYDAYPFYFTTKQQSGKTYDVEVLFNKDANYTIQILVNGYCVAKLYKNSATSLNMFASPNTFIIKNQSDAEIVTESIEYNGTSDVSKYPNIKVLYVERIDEGLDSLVPGYSVSQNKVVGWASYLKNQGRKYVGMKDIERILDGSMRAHDNFLWNFQLDDSSIGCVTNANVRNSLLRNNIRPSIAMMLSESLSDKDLQIVKASERAGFEYHIHSCYTDGGTSMAYYTYSQLDANITEAIEKFIEIFGSIPTVIGKHSGKGHYGLCRYLKNKGFRIIFSDNEEDASLNEITRYACKRNVIQEASSYTDIKNLDRTY